MNNFGHVKYCFVSGCTNTSVNNPMKIYLTVPKNEETRAKWFQAVAPDEVVTKTGNLYACEDHFDLPNDAENWIYYKTIGKNLRLKKNALPKITTTTVCHMTDSEKKRKLENVKIYESSICRKKLQYKPQPSTSTGNHQIGNYSIHIIHLWNESSLVESSMDTQLHQVSANEKDEDTAAITNYPKFEEIYIKEVPLEETFEDSEFYENVLSSVKKEECVTDNDEQSDKEYTGNSDIKKTENVDSNSFCCVKEECISDDDEQSDKEYENLIIGNNDKKIENVDSNSFCCVKEECTNDDDEQSDKEYENPIIGNNDIKKIENVDSNSFCCVKEECISDDDEQSNEEYENPIIGNNDTSKTDDTNSKIFYCLECNRSFTRKANLIEHVEIHRGSEGEYKCTICDKMFRHSSNLSKHIKFHTERKENRCSICKKSFTQNYDLKRHMNTHTGIKDYQCSICKKLFTQSSSLNLHVRIHTGEKDFKCTMCEKSFRLNCHLKRHMNIHSRENNSTVLADFTTDL